MSENDEASVLRPTIHLPLHVGVGVGSAASPPLYTSFDAPLSPSPLPQHQSQSQSPPKARRSSTPTTESNSSSPSPDERALTPPPPLRPRPRRHIVGSHEVALSFPPPPPPGPPPPPSRTLKVLVIGPSKSGKTSLLSRYASRTFNADYIVTIGADYTKRDVTIPSASGPFTVRLQLWDVAGQDRFSRLTRAYFKGAHAVVVVCDLTRPTTLKDVPRWKDEVDSRLGPDVPCLLMGNKVDLLGPSEAVERGRELAGLCDRVGIREYRTVCAKTGEGVDDGFNWLIREVERKEKAKPPREREGAQEPAKDTGIVDLEAVRRRKKRANFGGEVGEGHETAAERDEKWCVVM